MNLLSPGFLLGAVAVGAPLIAHLMRLRVNNRVEFSAMHFLEPAPPKKASKRWEDFVLMAARIAVLLLLSLAFARPYSQQKLSVSLPATLPRRVVALVDTSASMRRPGFFAEARAAVERMGAQLGPFDEMAVFAFDRTVRSVFGFEAWGQTPAGARREFLNASLARLEPGWAQTNLDDALKSVVEQTPQKLADAGLEVVVVSDFQEGAHLAKIQGLRFPEHVRLKAVPVWPKGAADSGVSLQWLVPDPGISNPEASVRLRVSAGVDFPGDRVKLRMEGERLSEWTVPVSAGKSKVAVVPGKVPKYASIKADGDVGPFSKIWVGHKPETVALAAVEGKRTSGDHSNASYFISEALSALGSRRVETVFGDDLGVERDSSVALWISNGGMDPNWNARMRAGVEHGALGFLTLKQGCQAKVIEGLIGPGFEISEAVLSDFAVLGDIDHEHPLFAPFGSAQFSDFSRVRFWHYRKLGFAKESGVRVVARFEGGDPALLECSVGRGRVFVWTSEWRPHDSQWVLSSRCVPFLSGLLDCAEGAQLPFVLKTPLEAFAVPKGATEFRNSEGKRFAVHGSTASLDEPGVYEIQPSGGRVVVNVAPEEARIRVLTSEALSKIGFTANASRDSGVPADPHENAREASPVDVDAEKQQGAWRYVLAVVLAFLLFETWWAGRLSAAAKAGI